MECEVLGKKYKGVKETNNLIIFYFLDDEIVKCSWKHKIKSNMISDDEYFLETNGITINNNRNDKDFAYISDNLYLGTKYNITYPKK